MFINSLSIFVILIVSSSSIFVENVVPYNVTQSKLILFHTALAFCPQSCIQTWSCKYCKQLPGVQNVKYITNNITKVAGFAGYDPKQNAIIVSFRGSNNKPNWFEDFSFDLTQYGKCKGCQVHLGFYQDFKSIEKILYNHVRILKKTNPKSKIITTGHSLGAAISVIAAIQLKYELTLNSSEIQIHNFGQPRVGNINFAKFIDQKIQHRFRVVHNRDIVPHLPPEAFGYHHISNQIFFDQDNHDYVICNDNGQDPSCSNKFFPDYLPSDHEKYFIDLSNVQC